MSTFKPSFDARPDRLDLRDREYLPPLKNLPPTFPSTDDVEELFAHYTLKCNLILDQGKEGACTGFGLAAVINYLNWKDSYFGSGTEGHFISEEVEDFCVLPVSERMLYHNARLYDEWEGEEYEGSSCRGALKGWHRHGVCTSALWPYRDRKGKVKFIQPNTEWAANAVETPLGAYYRINKDSVVDMQSAIYEVGAVYCSCTVHAGWDNPAVARKKKSDDPFSLLPSVSSTGHTEETGGHAFALVGYTRDGFIVQNSWGANWGFNGFAIVSYQDWVANGMDAWVVVRGAPINKSSSPASVVHQALQDEQAQKDDPVGQSVDRMRDSYPYKNQAVTPWSEEKAYQHTLVIGNNGRAVQKLIEFECPEDSVERVSYSLPKKWMEDTSGLDVVIYVHGGLNSEKASLRRAQVIGPYFVANGIYPIFITWRTGIVETLGNILSEFFGSLQDDSRAGGLLEDVRVKFKEKLDRTLEITSKKAGGKSIWSEMKENAELASASKLPGTSGSAAKTRGAMVNLANCLLKLEGVNIHLAGHSAGAILLGHWLDSLRRKNVKFKTLSLFAPACSMRFSNKYFQPAIKKGKLKKSSVHFDILSDERERADNVVNVYGKSLLYLISRALEDMHKEPLLGLEAAWHIDDKYGSFMDKNRTTITDEEKSRMKEIEEWSKFWGENSLPHIHDKSRTNVNTSLEGDQVKLAHGSFDNDLLVMTNLMCRILDVKSLKVKIENLGGF